MFSAAELMAKEFGEERWAVHGILPEGVTIFAGKSKIGKSWMAYGLALAVASGGHALGKIPVDRGDVLYLALEDNERRLKKRLKKLLQGEPAPAGLDLATSYPRVGEGLEEELEAWLASHPDAKLVIIDTLKRIRPPDSGRRNIYDVDYEALQPLLPLAAGHGVSVVVIHHLNQQPADDPLDEISGSTGLIAVVDNLAILKRDRGQADAYLFVTGRDIEEDQKLALSWDGPSGSWTVEGDAEDYRRSAEQRKVLDWLGRINQPVGPLEVSEATGLPYGSVRVLMPKMMREGLLENPAYGKYVLSTAHSAGSIAANLTTTTNTDNSCNSITSSNSSNTTGEGTSVNGVYGEHGELEDPSCIHGFVGGLGCHLCDPEIRGTW